MTAVTFPLRPPRLALAICGRRWQNEYKVYVSKFRCRNNKQQTTSNEETWSRGRNSRLQFDVNVMLNLSIVLKKLCPIARDTVEIELLMEIMHCALRSTSASRFSKSAAGS